MSIMAQTRSGSHVLALSLAALIGRSTALVQHGYSTTTPKQGQRGRQARNACTDDNGSHDHGEKGGALKGCCEQYYQACQDGQADAKRNPNASEDDRNPDLSIFSAALSQLSYRGKLLCIDV